MLVESICKRLRNGCDAVVMVVARDGERGIGKTSFSIDLAKSIHEEMGIHEWTWKNAALHPSPYSQLYDSLAPENVVVADDFEKYIDPRRSMSKTNVEISNLWSMWRDRQIVSILNFPSTGQCDERLWKLANYKVVINRRGEARPYTLHISEYHNTWYPRRMRVLGRRGRKVTLYFDDYSKGEDYKMMKILKKYYGDQHGKDFRKMFNGDIPSNEDIIEEILSKKDKE